MSTDGIKVVPAELRFADRVETLNSCDPSFGVSAPTRSSRATSSVPVPPPVPVRPARWGALQEAGLVSATATTAATAAEVGGDRLQDAVKPELFALHGAQHEATPSRPEGPASKAGLVEFEQVEAIEMELDDSVPADSSVGPPEGGGMLLEPENLPDLELDWAGARPRRPMRPRGVDFGTAWRSEQDFWSRLPFAFVAPLMGHAWILLVFGGVASAMLMLLVSAQLGLYLTLTFMAPALVFLTGLLSETFMRLAQSGADNDEGLPLPTLGDTTSSAIMRSGFATIGMAVLLFGGPVYLNIRGYISPLTTMGLLLVPYLYWPMALTVQGVQGEPMAIFNIARIVRCAIKVPLKYGAVVLGGFVLSNLLALANGVVALGLGFGLSNPDSWTTAVIASFTVGMVCTLYLHGVLGYAMGRLVASEDQLSEILK